MEDALVCTILACSAAVCCQEEEEKQRKRRKIWTRKSESRKSGHEITDQSELFLSSNVSIK